MKFLIIDDNPGDRELIVRELKKEFTDAGFVEISRQSDLNEALSRGDFDAVITDYLLNWTDGLKILEVVKERFPNVPIVMVTDSGTEEVAAEGMNAGLDDYVIKRNLLRLPFAVQESLARIRAQEALRMIYNELESRVEERTAELSQANVLLKHEIEERKRVEQERERYLQELHAIAQITSVAMRTLDLEELLDTMLDRLIQVTGADAAAVLLKEDNRLVAKASIGMGEEPPRGFSIEIGRGFSGTVAKQLKPCYVEDAQIDPLTASPVVKRLGVRSMLGVPLKQRDELIGVLHIDWRSIHPRDEHEVRTLEIIADRMTLAITNAQLFRAEVEAQEQARYELEISSLLLKAADTLGLSLDLRTMLNALGHIILEATAKKRITVTLVDKIAHEYEIAGTLGKPTYRIGERFSLDTASPGYRRALEEKQTVIIDYEESHAKESMPEEAKKLNPKFALFVPLIAGDTVIGAIAVDTPGERAEFSGRAIELVEGIASQAAIAIENARLHEKTIARARTFEAVWHMGSLITSTLNMEEALGRIIDYSMLLLDVPSAAVLLFDRINDEFKVAAREGISPRLAKSTLSLTDVKALGLKAYVPGTMCHIETLSKAPFFEAAAKAGFKYVVISPIYVDHDLRGIIVNQHTAPISLSDEDVAAFKLFVNLAAIAIKNAERYEAEHSIADTLQGALLTMPERIEGIEFGHLYRSATETTRVGGDFFDLFELEHDKVGIIVGDVAGKGLGAATLTAIVRNTIRAYAYDEASPAAVMTKVNDVVVKASPPSSFVTVFFGIVDIKSGALTYCSAGHPPPMIKRASKISLLEEHSPIIGAFRDIRFEEAEAALKERDILVLYTDGITEARCDKGFFEEAGLINALKDMKRLTAKEAPQAIFNEVMACSKGKISDDIALLALSLSGVR